MPECAGRLSTGAGKSCAREKTPLERTGIVLAIGENRCVNCVETPEFFRRNTMVASSEMPVSNPTFAPPGGESFTGELSP
jgi:hypothetical protein